MKNFYYKKTEIKRATYGGLKVKASVYTAKGGKIFKVCDCSWHTSSFPGEESAVFQALMECGQISKKWNESSCCEWRGCGYFAGDVCKHFSILELA